MRRHGGSERGREVEREGRGEREREVRGGGGSDEGKGREAERARCIEKERHTQIREETALLGGLS